MKARRETPTRQHGVLLLHLHVVAQRGSFFRRLKHAEKVFQISSKKRPLFAAYAIDAIAANAPANLSHYRST